MSASVQPTEDVTNEPADTALKQQRMKAWNPILDPLYVIATLLVVGAAFIPAGLELLKINDRIVEMIKTYDSFNENNISSGLTCGISEANEKRSCTIEFEVKKDMVAPVLLYYEIENFYQNHREYTTSRDDRQLLGAETQTALSAKDCEPLNILNGVTINPCGLIANTFFNDIIKLAPNSIDSEGNQLTLIEDNIAWKSDVDYLFAQPKGFKHAQCASCNDSDCECSGEWTCKEKYQDPVTNICYLYTYPKDNTTQYLYETYSDIISPIEGVMNEHFIVWMRVAAKPKFRKLYGYFDDPIKAGTKITFNVLANWEVKSFKGTKKLVLTTTSIFGGKNPNFGRTFFGCGVFFLATGLFFGLKQTFKPRRLAEKKYLRFKDKKE